MRGDITAAIANAYTANPAASLETLKAQYQTTQVLFALAELDGNGDSLALALFGSDALGPSPCSARSRPRKASIKPSLRRPRALPSRRCRSAGSSPAALAGGNRRGQYAGQCGRCCASPIRRRGGSRGSGDGAILGAEGMAGHPHPPSKRARRSELDLRSVNPRSAEIGFNFPGGAERLAAMAATQGLSVENGPDGLIIRTR